MIINWKSLKFEAWVVLSSTLMSLVINFVVLMHSKLSSKAKVCWIRCAILLILRSHRCSSTWYMEIWFVKKYAFALGQAPKNILIRAHLWFKQNYFYYLLRTRRMSFSNTMQRYQKLYNFCVLKNVWLVQLYLNYNVIFSSKDRMNTRQ